MASPALRSKQLRAAELVATGLTYAEAGELVGRSERTLTRWLRDPALRAISAGETPTRGEVGPVETLRGALQATKANGQPDWPTRVAAVKTLAALRPDELEQVEPENEQQRTPSIVVYDLPPGAGPVVHRATSGGETPVSAAATPPAKQPPDSLSYHFSYIQPDGDHDTIGSWSPPRLDQSADGIVRGMFVHTNDPAEAEHWRAELAAGRLPIDIENDS
jgi:Homeodomain-like domain